MGFLRSFIFSKTVLGILIFACFIVTGLDLYIDDSHTKVINQAALEIAKNEVDVITQLVKTLREGQVTTTSGAQLVQELNQHLNEAPGGITVAAITPDSKKNSFQENAYKSLSQDSSRPYYQLVEMEEGDVLHYAVFTRAFSDEGLILQLNIPMVEFQSLQKKEAITTLWVLILLGVSSSLLLAIFAGYTRRSAEVLAESQKKDLEFQKQLTAAYERFFPREFIDILQKKNILEINLGDQVEKKMAVMFSDIRNFTSIIEHHSPAESFKFINDYLAEVGPVIREHTGFIDKFIGDSIMAIFNKCDDALKASIKMLSLLRQAALKPENVSKTRIEIGVGLHYGSLMVGTIGEAQRMDGSVISDIVNTASRLEALNKTYGTNIIISEQFLDNLETRLSFKIRFLDQIYVKGKTSPTKLFEVFDYDSPEIITKKEQIRDQYQNAVNCYQARKFQDAINILNDCQKILPEDRSIQIYLKRANQWLSRPLPEGWDPIPKLYQKDEIE